MSLLHGVHLYSTCIHPYIVTVLNLRLIVGFCTGSAPERVLDRIPGCVATIFSCDDACSQVCLQIKHNVMQVREI